MQPFNTNHSTENNSKPCLTHKPNRSANRSPLTLAVTNFLYRRRVHTLVLPTSISLLCQTAFAQNADGSPTSSPAQDFVGFLAMAALVCLLVGLVKPQAFQKLFKANTSRGRVGWTFGGLLFGLMILNSLFAPNRPDTITNETTANSSIAAKEREADERVRLAEERAKAAEARAKRAESVTNKEENSKGGKSSELAESVAAKEKAANSDSASAITDDQESRNVSVQEIEGLGKREVGTVDDVHYIISEIETASSIGNDFSSTQADGQFYVVRVVAYNNDKKTHGINTSIIKLLDDQGREFDPSSNGSTALVMSGDKTAELFMAQIQPGTRKQFSLVYDAPADASGLKLKIPGGFLSRTGAAIIKAPK